MEIKESEFSEIVEEYSSMIYKIIHSLHIQKDIDQFYQEGLIALWYAWKGYEDSKASFTTYAYWTIRGMLLNLIKKDRRYHDKHCAWKAEMEELISDESNKTIDEQLQEIECYAVNLTEKQKIWLIEYIVNGKKLEEIAKEYGTTVASVKAWRRSAIKCLRALVKC
ncbi:sigma-70 family RNA polymerase sigma factor [Bacillus sp. FJAT-45066]|uniref:sigma-70 family RNA polymerase sigma factor n=1 Tax=Bacillus sp. FJAT-45066 TaxID=2011010 RepID=UPI000BB7A050|nr:sigma-70 family RNA polymerase sigma factor [Bacillus sp. FJAT-45066]